MSHSSVTAKMKIVCSNSIILYRMGVYGFFILFNYLHFCSYRAMGHDGAYHIVNACSSLPKVKHDFRKYTNTRIIITNHLLSLQKISQGKLEQAFTIDPSVCILSEVVLHFCCSRVIWYSTNASGTCIAQLCILFVIISVRGFCTLINGLTPYHQLLSGPS
jgi:hypothetical protein